MAILTHSKHDQVKFVIGDEADYDYAKDSPGESTASVVFIRRW